jgi:hypothetical protein
MVRQTFATRLSWRPSRAPAAATLVSASLFVAACTLDGDSGQATVSRSLGAVIVDWSIRGAKDPADCRALGVATLHVSLSDSSGGSPMDSMEACTTFATTIGGVQPDSYTGTVLLLDATGRARTAPVNLTPFSVFANTGVAIAVDFPVLSFR